MHGGPPGSADGAVRSARRMIDVWAGPAEVAGWIVVSPAMVDVVSRDGRTERPSSLRDFSPGRGTGRPGRRPPPIQHQPGSGRIYRNLTGIELLHRLWCWASGLVERHRPRLHRRRLPGATAQEPRAGGDLRSGGITGPEHPGCERAPVPRRNPDFVQLRPGLSRVLGSSS